MKHFFSPVLSLFPALWIGLFVGVVVSGLHVQKVVQNGLIEASSLSASERSQLIDDIAKASADEIEGRLLLQSPPRVAGTGNETESLLTGDCSAE